MEITKIENDIKKLIEIYEDLDNNYDDYEGDLTDDQKNELYRITNIKAQEWDNYNLNHYIGGMQRVIQLIKQ